MTTDVEITASIELSGDKAGVLCFMLRLELTLTDGDLLIVWLETATGDDISDDDETDIEL